MTDRPFMLGGGDESIPHRANCGPGSFPVKDDKEPLLNVLQPEPGKREASESFRIADTTICDQSP